MYAVTTVNGCFSAQAYTGGKPMFYVGSAAHVLLPQFDAKGMGGVVAVCQDHSVFVKCWT